MILRYANSLLWLITECISSHFHHFSVALWRLSIQSGDSSSYSCLCLCVCATFLCITIFSIGTKRTFTLTRCVYACQPLKIVVSQQEQLHQNEMMKIITYEIETERKKKKYTTHCNAFRDTHNKQLKFIFHAWEYLSMISGQKKKADFKITNQMTHEDEDGRGQTDVWINGRLNIEFEKTRKSDDGLVIHPLWMVYQYSGILVVAIVIIVADDDDDDDTRSNYKSDGGETARDTRTKHNKQSLKNLPKVNSLCIKMYVFSLWMRVHSLFSLICYCSLYPPVADY